MTTMMTCVDHVYMCTRHTMHTRCTSRDRHGEKAGLCRGGHSLRVAVRGEPSCSSHNGPNDKGEVVVWPARKLQVEDERREVGRGDGRLVVYAAAIEVGDGPLDRAAGHLGCMAHAAHRTVHAEEGGAAVGVREGQLAGGVAEVGEGEAA